MFRFLQNLDGGILLWIQEWFRQGWLDPVVIFYTHLGDKGVLMILLSVAMLLYKPTRKAGIGALMAMMMGVIITNLLLKGLVSRPRPFLEVEGLLPLISAPDPHSFPSGHTTGAVAAAAAWWKLVPKKWIRYSGAAMALCMGLSRLYVGVHYPTDVLGGACVGLFCAWLACKAGVRWVWKNKIISNV